MCMKYFISFVILIGFTKFIFSTKSKDLLNASKCGFDYNVPYIYDYANISTLKSVSTIFRHGARTALHSYPNDPYLNYDLGVPGVGQLLPGGRVLGYELGRYFRHRYDGYLNRTYTYNELFVQSSSFDRTIVTGQYVLAGLYQISNEEEVVIGLKWEGIPIRTIPIILDNKIGFGENCDTYNRIYNAYTNSTPFLILNELNKDLFEYMTKATGTIINDFKSVFNIADTLRVECQSGLDLPHWTFDVYPNRTDVFERLIFTSYTGTKELARLKAGPILTEIVNNFKVEIGTGNWTGNELMGFRRSKMFVYSGHDTTISCILNALGVHDNDPPLYTSGIMFELHNIKNLPQIPDDSNYEIKLFYKKQRNMKAIQLIFPECPSPCTLKKFQEVFHWLFLTRYQWTMECQNENVQELV